MALRNAWVRWCVVGLAGGFALATAPCHARGAEDPRDGFHIHYFKAPRALTLDSEGRMAAFMVEPQDPHAPAGARRVISADRLTPMAISGWSLVTPAPGAAARGAVDAHQLAAKLDELAQDARVQFVSPVFVDDFGGPLVVTPDLLIGFQPQATREQIEEILANEKLPAARERDWAGMPNVYRIRSDSRSGLEVLASANRLAQMDQVLFAEPDMMFTGRAHFTPNDPGYLSCWGIHNTGQFSGVIDRDMDGPEAWDVTLGTPGVRVLILDSGSQQDHPDLHQIAGADVTSEGPGSGGPVNAFDNHGTAVMGCVSASINNALGTVGIAPGCESVSVRTFITINSSGNWDSTASWTVNALTFGQSVGARVSNNSNGYGFTSAAIATKYSTSRSMGMVHFASAGNSGGFVIGYPASLSTVNAVGAVTPSGAIASFSDRGPGIFITAPGTSVYSTDRTGGAGYGGGDYAFVQGTSFSSPYTAGVAALVLSKNELQSAADVEATLLSTSVDLGAAGYDETFGWGFVNARAALDATPAAGPPGSFNLLAPAADAVNVVRLPTFSWSSATNAPTYTFTLDDDADFSSPIVQVDTVLLSYTYTGPALAAASTYYWRVSATNVLGSQVSSPESLSFSTIMDPPLAFPMTAPGNGASNIAVLPLLKWDAAPLAESYVVTIDNNADLSSPIVSFMTTLTQFIPGVPLDANTTYYWTVSAANPIGQTEASTGVWSFMTTVAPPSPFSLLSPADGPNIADSTPTLVWAAAGGADSYTLTVDDDLNFASPEVSESGLLMTSFTVAPGSLTNGLRYYWKVRAVNGAGDIGSSPSIFSFGLLVPPCQGDANGDFLVNFEDVSSVIANWLADYWPVLVGPGDANHDGDVDFIDVSNVLSNWQAECQQ